MDTFKWISFDLECSKLGNKLMVFVYIIADWGCLLHVRYVWSAMIENVLAHPCFMNVFWSSINYSHDKWIEMHQLAHTRIRMRIQSSLTWIPYLMFCCVFTHARGVWRMWVGIENMCTVWLCTSLYWCIQVVSTIECSSKKRIDDVEKRHDENDEEKAKADKKKKKKKHGRHRITQRITILATHILKSKTKAEATQ